jgi:hypothetical protein
VHTLLSPEAKLIAAVIPRREVQATLMEQEVNMARGIGVTAWLVLGLKIQETQ